MAKCFYLQSMCLPLTSLLVLFAPALLQHWQLRQSLLQDLQSAAAAAAKGDLQESSTSSSNLHDAMLAVQQHGAGCLQSHM
jgi:hypothetical protein